MLDQADYWLIQPYLWPKSSVCSCFLRPAARSSSWTLVIPASQLLLIKVIVASDLTRKKWSAPPLTFSAWPTRRRTCDLACGSRSPVREIPELGHGLFTHFLLQGLRGEANSRADTMITVTELYEYVRGQMDTWASSHGGQTQYPTYELAGYGDLTVSYSWRRGSDWARTKPFRPVVPSGDALLAPLRGSSGFIGRKEELRRILQVLTTTSDMALLVKGEPGTGKTTLINRMEGCWMT